MTNKEEVQEKHSPLPWSVGVRQKIQNGDGIDLAIGDLTDWVVARAASKLDAALIVKAVNNHEALVEALRQAREYISEQTWDARTRPSKRAAEGLVARVDAVLERVDQK